MSSLQVLKAAQITVAYCGIYSLTLFNQVVKKKLLHAKAKKERKTFERYDSLDMRPNDRLTANFLEWMPVFLGPLWAMAATETLSDACMVAAWTYVGLRALYFGLIVKFGVNVSGHNVSLWASTLPSYACLSFLLYQSINAVFVTNNK